jgi:hypothetical protein
MDGKESPVEGLGFIRGLDTLSAFFYPSSNTDRLVARVQELRLTNHYKCKMTVLLDSKPLLALDHHVRYYH